MNIEPIGAHDLDRLGPLWLALHAHHRKVAPRLAPFVGDDISWPNRKRQYEEVAAGEWLGLVAREGDRDLGYMICAKRPMQWNATFAIPPFLWELVTLVVTAEARGGGIGATLLDAVETFIARQDVRTTLIGVIPDNASAVALYRKRGYRPIWITLTRFQRPRPKPAAPTVEIRALEPAAVDALAPLWLTLHHHHQAVSPELGPFVPDAASWPIIRELWAKSAKDGLLLAAQEGDRTVGIASAGVYGLDQLTTYTDTWVTGDRAAEMKFLVVAGGCRGRGIGAALMDAMDIRLADRGVHDQFVGAIAPNAGAIRFYESRGFRPAWLELMKL
jgi:ribosomal protein S18 acetylase RimI-like enzyme